MVDVSSSWVCESEGRSLSDVLRIYNNEDPNENHEQQQEQNCSTAPVLLSQPEESAPCVLSLNCSPPSVIRRLEFVTEARTVEVYDQSGEYCGTVRGERDQSVHTDSPDSGPFYRKQLVLDHPSASCDVKLLSLCGRRCVRVLSVSVGVETVRSGVSVNHSIDLQQVQSMMEEMGTSLSPGAQHLMDMVQFQQQNQTSSLSSLFPMLMGGRALPQMPSPLQFPPPFTSSAAETPSNQIGAMSHDSSDSTCSESSESRSPVSPAHISEMMSQLLKGRGQALDSAPDLLPVLQSVCGHVTQLRLDNAAALKEINDGTCACDPEMERRLEQMERRLKEHFDRRLDALEQKLDSVLNLALTNQNLLPEFLPKSPTEEKIHQETVN
ncbi:ATPase PAAT [Boleophthalmus pectinirostris]|uniref:ATPase PAAT n=1 Tax=Boleophthalmus pectinirostris TaxID=150288 RepID=UPI00242BC837|nr:ATPase PAAT [Boleophthalmus pectinirostris]XP_055006204.1 ATPase PAAT [Boleophthalmus pectinirostris]